MTPKQLKALRAAYAYVCLNTGNGAPHPEVSEWGFGSYPEDQSTWCDPQWVRELCEEAGVLVPLALPGVWTPWAQVLCYPCHGTSGPVTSTEGNSLLRAGEPETGSDFGEAICKCDECGTAIWIRSDTGKLAALRDQVNESGHVHGVHASLMQTGGLCSALMIAGLDSTSADPKIVVSALDGPYCLGHYANDEAWGDGDYGSMSSVRWDAPTREVLEAALGLLKTE